MKKILTKIVTMLLLVAMIGSMLVGCGKKEVTADTTTVGVDATEATNEEVTVTDAVKEPVTLTIYGAQGFSGQYTSGIQDDAVAKAITDATGVSLDWDMAPSADKTNVIVASGDLPDIFIMNDIKSFEALIQSGEVLDVTNLVESNGSNITENASKAVEFSKTNFSNGTNSLYFIPGRVTNGDSSSVMYSPIVGYYMRWDYYKEIGSPVLATDEDVVNALAAMQKNHPTTPEGKPTYAFSMWQDWGKWHYTVMSEVVNGVGGVPGANAINFVDGANNFAFVDGLNDAKSPLWVDSALYNKVYRAGIMDPDSFTQGYAQASAKMDAGQVLCQAAVWLTTPVNAALATTVGENAGYLSIPRVGASYNSANYNPTGLSSYWAISKDCKNPERAMDVINYFFSEEGSRNIFIGVKGDIWENDASGKAVLTEKGLTLKQDPNFIATSGATKYANFAGVEAQDSNGQFLDLYSEPSELEKTLTPLRKEWLAAYDSTSENEFWHKNGGFAFNTAFTALVPAAPEDIIRLDAKINSYLQEKLAYLVMAESDEAYAEAKQQIIDDISAMDGYQAYVDWAKGVVETARAGVENFK